MTDKVEYLSKSERIATQLTLAARCIFSLFYEWKPQKHKAGLAAHGFV